MLRTTKSILGHVLEALDDDIGRCKDLLFDDLSWTIRYMVADTRKWLPGRRVLISPIALARPDWNSRRFPVRLTCEQIRSAPPLDEDAPVTRQHERDAAAHFGYQPYWAGPAIWGWSTLPGPLFGLGDKPSEVGEDVDEDEHLRSVVAVTGYRIKALDGPLGHVESFLVDDDSWNIRYVVIDTRNWLPAPKVLVPPACVGDVRWAVRELDIQLTQAQIRSAPGYDPSMPINRGYEARLYDAYGRPYPAR